MEETAVQPKTGALKLLRWVIGIDLLLITVIVALALTTNLFIPQPSKLPDIAFEFDGVQVTVEEFRETARYFNDIAGYLGVFSDDGFGLITDTLIERKLVEQWAEENNFSVSAEELLEKARELHTDGGDPPLSDYPGLEAQARVEVLKPQIEPFEGTPYDLWLLNERNNEVIVEYEFDYEF